MKIYAITDQEKKTLILALNEKLYELKKEQSKYTLKALRIIYDIEIRNVEFLIRDILTHENKF